MDKMISKSRKSISSEVLAKIGLGDIPVNTSQIDVICDFIASMVHEGRNSGPLSCLALRQEFKYTAILDFLSHTGGYWRVDRLAESAKTLALSNMRDHVDRDPSVFYNDLLVHESISLIADCIVSTLNGDEKLAKHIQLQFRSIHTPIVPAKHLKRFINGVLEEDTRDTSIELIGKLLAERLVCHSMYPLPTAKLSELARYTGSVEVLHPNSLNGPLHSAIDTSPCESITCDSFFSARSMTEVSLKNLISHRFSSRLEDFSSDLFLAYFKSNQASAKLKETLSFWRTTNFRVRHFIDRYRCPMTGTRYSAFSSMMKLNRFERKSNIYVNRVTVFKTPAYTIGFC